MGSTRLGRRIGRRRAARYPRLSSAVDEAGEIFDVPLQVLLAGGGQLIPGDRAAVAVGLVDHEVAGVLQRLVRCMMSAVCVPLPHQRAVNWLLNVWDPSDT